MTQELKFTLTPQKEKVRRATKPKSKKSTRKRTRRKVKKEQPKTGYKYHDKYLNPLKRLHTLRCPKCKKGTTFDIGAPAGGNVLKCPKCGTNLAKKTG